MLVNATCHAAKVFINGRGRLRPLHRECGDCGRVYVPRTLGNTACPCAQFNLRGSWDRAMQQCQLDPAWWRLT